MKRVWPLRTLWVFGVLFALDAALVTVVHPIHCVTADTPGMGWPLPVAILLSIGGAVAVLRTGIRDARRNAEFAFSITLSCLLTLSLMNLWLLATAFGQALGCQPFMIMGG